MNAGREWRATLARYEIRKARDLAGGPGPFAKRLGVTRRTVERWLRGDYQPGGPARKIIEGLLKGEQS